MPEEGIKLCPHSEILSYEEIIRLVKIFSELGVKKVRITGGEPLVRKNLPFLIANINKIEGIKDIALTTNGIYLLEKIVDLVHAGLKRVNISLDTLKPQRFEMITKVSGLKKVLEGIEKSLELGLNPVKINVVLIRGINDDEIIDFVKFAEKRPLHVRFIEYMPWGNVQSWGMDKVVTTQETMMIIEKTFGSLTPIGSSSGGPSVNYRIEGIKGTIGFINPVSSHFCHSCNRIRLTADGKLRLCLFSNKEVDVKAVLRTSKDDEKLKQFLQQSIALKPEGRDLSEHIKTHKREMNQIGG